MWLLTAMGASAGELSVARPFGSHMVLPMGNPVAVHGEATPGSKVSVRFGSVSKDVVAGNDRKWSAVLPPLPASKDGRNLEIESGSEKVVLEDVLVGRVYLFSGQSNMDFPLSRAVGGKEEADKAPGQTMIRLFNLTSAPTDPRTYDGATLARLNNKDHFQGAWTTASPGSAGSISAIAWWVGTMVQGKTGMPVGIVENAVGGSETEAWLPREILESRAEYRSLLTPKWLENDKVSAWARSRAKQNLGKELSANHPFKPGFLFESGVRDWAGFPFEAVVWYQGETNAERHDDSGNGQLIRDLIQGWRGVLGNRELPFYLVQLPRIGGADPLRRYWPEYREVQARVAKAVPGVRLVVTQDLGWDSPDVHPPDKVPVARRVFEAMSR
ncbi:hypothetical protein llg_00090 [Luteolibacter sp. LG18]|nr:hypothetical protein llg_00090 [Luteolibacter sp. LG18]